MHPNPLIRDAATGKDWKAASEAIRVEYCELHAPAQSKPITAVQLKERLDAFFESDDEFIGNLLIVQGIAATMLSDKISATMLSDKPR